MTLAGPDLDGLFAGLEDAPVLLLAVSGGPDSMALLGLATEWAAEEGRPKLHAATIDHGLRAEAAAEAAFVATAAARLGIPHATLPWFGDKPATRIQERARRARYKLLVDHARRLGSRHVLTAHHADDQAETVLMRLGRGSGVRGLGGMRRESLLAPDVTLVRPLLGCTKAMLKVACMRQELGFIEDPSNADPAYARVRLRAKMAAAAELGLDRANLGRLARRMRRAEQALDAEAARVVGLMRLEHDGRMWRADAAPLREAMPEIVKRVLERGVAHAVGPRLVRLESLERIADDVLDAVRAGRPRIATLAGTRIVVTQDRFVVIAPEPPRRRGQAAAKESMAAPDLA